MRKVVRFGCGIRGLGRFSVWSMGHSATTKAARRAAREVAVAAREEAARRTRANVEDLAAYFSARQRADAVDEWLNDKVGLLVQEAARRRSEQRLQCGVALAALRDRGESLREIARMAGAGEKTVRDLIRLAQAGDAGAAEQDELCGVGRMSGIAEKTVGELTRSEQHEPAGEPRRAASAGGEPVNGSAAAEAGPEATHVVADASSGAARACSSD